MEYLNNSELWKDLNESARIAARYARQLGDVANPTTVKRAELETSQAAELAAHSHVLQRFVGRYLRCKASVSDVRSDAIAATVSGVRLNYLMPAYSSETSLEDREVTLRYSESLRLQVSLLKKGDSIAVTGSILTITPELILELASLEKKACIVATACYGNENAAEVETLRRFRDNALLPTTVGTALVAAYYRVAPKLVPLIERSALLKRFLRRCILEPLVSRLIADNPDLRGPQ